MAKRVKWLCWSVVALLSMLVAVPASAVEHEDPYGRGFRFDFKEDGSNYVRLILFAQFWARLMSLNPGTEVNGQPTGTTGDFVLRRARFIAYTQTDRLLTMFHAGISNQSFRQFDSQLSVYDAYFDYRVTRASSLALHVGAGLHYWQGFSRASNGSALTLLPLDLPLVAFPTINLTDQFGRRLGVFVKGKVAQRLVYHWSLDRPFNRGETVYGAPTPGGGTLFNAEANTLSTGGYLEWQFWQGESDLLPFRQGSYLGNQSVLNVGAGYFFHPGSMTDVTAGGKRREHDTHLVGVDVFLELPRAFHAKGTLSAYWLYSYQYLGPSYVRHAGIANIADLGAGAALSGGGNAAPVSGTGHHLHGEVGYLFALPSGSLQPYATTTLSFFEAYDGWSPNVGCGLNYHLMGHHAKFTLQYQARPVWRTPAGFERLQSEAVLQVQHNF